MSEILTGANLTERLKDLSGWSITSDGKAITRDFHFTDFSTAFAFMTRVALAAEKADHHPDWSNVWNKVEIRLSTHVAGGITARDLKLAATVDRIAREGNRSS